MRESIRKALDPLCQEFRIDEEASGLQQARRWHLVSRSSGLLQRGVHGSDVMEALHPTPAVGGYPVEPALAAIRDLEGFDRGWYAGPVGWIGPQGAEFAVALRCGLVRDRTLFLFAGAGIVEGSDPAAEWQGNRTEDQRYSGGAGVRGDFYRVHRPGPCAIFSGR